MAKLVLDLKKSVGENASVYFDKAKKAKKKLEGAQQSLKKSLKRLRELEKKREKHQEEEREEERLKERKKEWYEKFRWFFSSEGFLVIGGRDATSNEIVIKKHTDNNDLVFHTDIAGSPFFVVKTKSPPSRSTLSRPTEKTIKEVADATCTFSRAFKLGLQSTSVFYVNPEQVSKKTKAGEYMGKGAFMIYGKTIYMDNKVNLAVGITEDNAIMSGPEEAIKKNCGKFVVLQQGKLKPSDAAKKIKGKIGGTIDEIIRALPSGDFEIKK